MATHKQDLPEEPPAQGPAHPPGTPATEPLHPPPAIPARAVRPRPVQTAPVLRPELQNWQVLPVEPGAADGDTEEVAIEGVATVISEPALPAPAPPADEHLSQGPGDQVDSVLIAALPEREVSVQPGAKATLIVSVLNNGTQPAIFDVHVEGWVHESWLPDGVRHVPVHPGERAAVALTIAPPRDAATTAGSFPLYVVVRSPQHLRRFSRLQATLVIQPFTDFSVGAIQPARPTLRAFQRSLLFSVPVTNKSNHPARLQVQGRSLGLPCTFQFTLDPSQKWQQGTPIFDMEPQETVDLLARVTVRSAPLFAGRPETIPFRLMVGVEGESHIPRSTSGELTYHAPIRPWHLATVTLAALLLLAVTGLLALAARLLLTMESPAPAAAQPAVQSPAAPIVIVLNQEPPQNSAPAAASAAPAPAQVAPAPNNGAPLLLPNQVTNPGDPAPSLPADAAPIASAPQPPARSGLPPAQSDPAALTYAQMFQEIALRYDLDWRMLAAQAYVESGFDSLALGNSGDMGLMQILPGTWREWAPSVGANDPFDAYSNTLVAATYLDHVRGLFGRRGLPQAQWMLVAYNWGPDKLGDFLDAGGTWDGLPAERARYATEILAIARTIP